MNVTSLDQLPDALIQEALAAFILRSQSQA